MIDSNEVNTKTSLGQEFVMELQWENVSYWLFSTAFGRLVEVEKSKHPTYVSALAEARRVAFAE